MQNPINLNNIIHHGGGLSSHVMQRAESRLQPFTTPEVVITGLQMAGVVLAALTSIAVDMRLMADVYRQQIQAAQAAAGVASVGHSD